VPVEGRYLKREYELGGITVAPLTPLIGATVRGVALQAGLRADQRAAVLEALRRHKVLFFRAQPLSIDAFVALGRALGTVQPYGFPSGSDTKPQPHPDVCVFAYDGERGREAFWHFDVLPTRKPARASLLRARVVPEVGGDTLFCDLGAVYDSLPGGQKTQLDAAVGIYDFVFERRLARFRGSSEAEAMALAPDPLEELPVVMSWPGSSGKVLFVNPGFLVGLKGVAPEDNREFLADLRARIDRPDFQCRFRWEPDDLALWDNQLCLHYATNNYWPERRIMERLTLTSLGEDSSFSGDALRC
jgi:taurine dioxygenase